MRRGGEDARAEEARQGKIHWREFTAVVVGLSRSSLEEEAEKQAEAEAGHDDSASVEGATRNDRRLGRTSRRREEDERREREGQGSRFGLEFLDDTGGRSRRS